MISDLINDFHQRIGSVIFILAAFDFSNEGFGFQKFDYFRQRSPIALQVSAFCLKTAIFII